MILQLLQFLMIFEFYKIVAVVGKQEYQMNIIQDFEIGFCVKSISTFYNTWIISMSIDIHFLTVFKNGYKRAKSYIEIMCTLTNITVFPI